MQGVVQNAVTGLNSPIGWASRRRANAAPSRGALSRFHRNGGSEGRLCKPNLRFPICWRSSDDRVFLKLGGRLREIRPIMSAPAFLSFQGSERNQKRDEVNVALFEVAAHGFLKRFPFTRTEHLQRSLKFRTTTKDSARVPGDSPDVTLSNLREPRRGRHFKG